MNYECIMNKKHFFSEKPTLVDVNLNIRSMGPVSETDMVSK